jgi:SAM-dependent methyltransferase
VDPVREPDVSQPPGAHVSDRWAQWRAEVDLAEYESRWERLEATGAAAHGEADLVQWHLSTGDGTDPPPRVLDAGCGMGRVGIELDRRGIAVMGVDLDDDLLAVARRHAPHLRWQHADLATADLGEQFPVVVLAGNVMLFCRPEARAPIVANLARHLRPGGHLIAGFSLDPTPGSLTLAEYDTAVLAAGLEPAARWSTWERAPFTPGGNYVVCADRQPR